LIQIRQVTDLAILLGVSIQKMGKMQGLARKQVSQCKGWRENQYYNAQAGEKLSCTMQRLTRK
jgi:hypothetical protein